MSVAHLSSIQIDMTESTIKIVLQSASTFF